MRESHTEYRLDCVVAFDRECAELADLRAARAALADALDVDREDVPHAVRLAFIEQESNVLREIAVKGMAHRANVADRRAVANVLRRSVECALRN